MSAFALVLVLTSACCHAWWNLILKKTGGGTGFFLLFSGLCAILMAPAALAVWWIEQRDLPRRAGCAVRASCPESPHQIVAFG